MTKKSVAYRLMIHLQLLLLIIVILYLGSGLFIPMCYALLLSVIMYPFCRWLEEKKLPRLVAIVTCMSVIAILFAALLTVLFIQFNEFVKDIPQLASKFDSSLRSIQQWIYFQFGITITGQQKGWQYATAYFRNNAGNWISPLLNVSTGILVSLVLIPLYTAIFLYHRETFVSFLKNVLPDAHKNILPGILSKVISTYSQFIKGTALVYLIVGTLNSIGLIALGIPHAILFGMTTAIMTIIPYIGIIISALLPISVAWITKDSIAYPLGVIAIFTFVQYLEANIIFPRIVATQLHVSTWSTLVAMIAGGLLWGVSGLILFIPAVGIMKIVFDENPSWHIYNILLARREREHPQPPLTSGSGNILTR